MFKIPKTIKIGGRIIPIKQIGSCDINGYSGSYSNWTNVIKIANDSDLSKEQNKICLIHEIIEHLNNVHEYDMPHKVIQGLAEHIYQIIIDNIFKKED